MEEKEINYDRLKQGGFLRQRQKEDFFSIRLRMVGGQLTSKQLRALADAAEKYGKGEIHITSRQGAEISFVELEEADDMLNELEAAGVHQGTCGPRVRGVIACQGNRVCTHGLVDALGIAEKIDEKYFAKELPSKFKFAVTGCPSSCMKPQENDFGIMGALEPEWIDEKCTRCGLCETICSMDAIKIEDNTFHFYEDKCNLCGDCVAVCPTSAWIESKSGFTLWVGGKVGRRPELAIKLVNIVDEKELFEIIEKTIEFYKENAPAGERFRDTIDRVGLDKYKEAVLG
ncbi:dissimilatory sulfite reductase (desulfoviridin) alpha/beta subunit [Methanohalophilus levihalophilus]|uniref:4Fe-4S binding protein n=1 Tax=Methanohalophilus levihalophilus TaxID=1431282 RepID=UPI001AE7E50A|nr:4Fe-4S binding protein [Methanohalophilus levihalophilus]MBP2031264.1 dissimilatory sulfite reductase (desulfoviridin) alpha/beta subunit [Methanohalophilus levihalophilus]